MANDERASNREMCWSDWGKPHSASQIRTQNRRLAGAPMWSYCNTCCSHHRLCNSTLATRPKVRGFKPSQRRWIFKGDQNLQYPFGGEVKPPATCRKILRHVKDPCGVWREILCRLNSRAFLTNSLLRYCCNRSTGGRFRNYYNRDGNAQQIRKWPQSVGRFVRCHPVTVVIFENSRSTGHEIACLLWNQEVYCSFQNSTPMLPTLSKPTHSP
jgi:hypothetical protein